MAKVSSGSMMGNSFLNALKQNIDLVDLWRPRKSSDETALGCWDTFYETGTEETFCMFLRFKENAMLVELMADGSCHKLHPSLPSVAVSESAGSMSW